LINGRCGQPMTRASSINFAPLLRLAARPQPMGPAMNIAAIISAIGVGTWLIANIIAALLLSRLNRNRGGQS
jgi:hypothetical protein